MKARRKDGKRFFLYLAYNAPQTPIQPPPERDNQASREPKLCRELIVALMRHVQQAGRTPWQPPTVL